jgi:hypothetical protein
MKNFSDRLEIILAGRKVNPWGKGLGMSGSVITAIKSGTPPGADYLGLIGYAEGASLDYLLTGKGLPFCVDTIAPALLLEKIKGGCPDLHIYFVQGPNKTLFVLYEKSAIQIKSRSVEFRKFEIVKCLPTGAIIDACKQSATVTPVLLDGPQFELLYKGLAGCYTCLGDEKTRGLFSNRIIPADAEKRLNFYDTLNDKKQNGPAAVNDNDRSTIDKTLLKAVLNLVDEVINDTGETINQEEKAIIIANLYSSATKQYANNQTLKPQTVLALIEMLN